MLSAWLTQESLTASSNATLLGDFLHSQNVTSQVTTASLCRVG